jgi:hypothetical protein
MSSAASGDTWTLRAQLLELVLADPDLLDIEFAVVTAAWSRRPPVAPPTTARRAGSGGPVRRAPTDNPQSSPTEGHEDPHLPMVARSPPPPQSAKGSPDDPLRLPIEDDKARRLLRRAFRLLRDNDPRCRNAMSMAIEWRAATAYDEQDSEG